ncbi:hypothetical protein KUA55_10365 [Enterococcus sp. ALS3]|uniref:Uncharacterized protein n=1 Tax=Enterococcus alishanensis TaxID=1303817 RepID=A0ABS6TDU3_9ENTE|nr:hypothetical protein [Enterococcus alishanensis]MBV7391085.1 hypothetical protein [Enterococcus alishanensis]
MLSLDSLTNDAKYLVSSMYKEYVSRRKDKIPKKQAISFNSVKVIHETLMKEWTLEDTLFTCRELRKKDFITGLDYSENSMIMISLSTDAIALMESKFKDDAGKALDFAIKIKSLIPFI